MSIDALAQVVRFAWRSLRRTPGITLSAIVTLAIGIGANTAIFSLLDAVIFRSLPVPAPRELVALYETAPDAQLDVNGGRGRYFRFSYPRYERLARALGARGRLTAMTPPQSMPILLAGASAPELARVQLVAPTFFDVMGVTTAAGRPLRKDDLALREGDAPAVVSFRFAQGRFGTPAAALGQTLRVTNVPARIVGVMPPGFAGAWSDDETVAWVPLSLQQAVGYVSNSSTSPGADRERPWMSEDAIAWLTLAARIPSADRAAAEASLKAENRAGVIDLGGTYPDPRERRSAQTHALTLQSLAQGYSRLRTPYSSVLYALLSLVAIVLLVGCGNIANLLMARAAGAERDVRVRLALGASARRLVAQALAESLLIAAAGAAGGFAVGIAAGRTIARGLLGGDTSLPQAFTPDARIAGFTIAISLLTAVAFGVLPMARTLRGARRGLNLTRERQLHGSSATRGMRPLVACQIALSFVGVLAAVLLGRTLVNYLQVDPGFHPDRVVTVALNTDAMTRPASRTPPSADTLVAAAMTVPGAISASASRCGLLSNCSDSSGFTFDNGRVGVLLNENWVSPDFFRTVGIPVVAGRPFLRSDTASSPRVAIVSASIARTQFPGGNAIGRRLGFDSPDTEIVGIVNDVRSLTLHDDPLPMVYFPAAQPAAFATALSNVDVLVTGRPAASVATIRDAIRRADSALAITAVAPMSDSVDRDLAREAIAAYLAGAFSALTLLLSSIGLYGVLSYIVTKRTPELGVRLALGSTPRRVLRLVMSDGLKMLGVGVVLGVVAAVAAARTIQTLLFGVQPHDPTAYVLVGATLLTVTLLASFGPARRASRVDPAVALRSE